MIIFFIKSLLKYIQNQNINYTYGKNIFEVQIIMEKHKELKKTLIDYSIVTCFDYIRTFDENNFTDFSLNKVSNIINSESKYILIGMSATDGNPFVLYNPNLEYINDEIFQNMIFTNEISGYNSERNRVFGYYEGDGFIRFGNKSSNPLRIRFEEATIDEIIRKKYYINNIPNNFRHELIQSYILNLGESLGYYVSIAKNDRKKQERLSYDKLLAKTPNPKDLLVLQSNNVIEMIDVIWFDNNNPIAAFEVEFSNNYDKAIRRLHELDHNLKNPSFYNIICSYDNKYDNIKNFCSKNYSFISSLLPDLNLYFLPLSRLDNSLKLKDIYGYSKEINSRIRYLYDKNSLIPLIPNTFIT
jgi:hypothetical protein